MTRSRMRLGRITAGACVTCGSTDWLIEVVEDDRTGRSTVASCGSCSERSYLREGRDYPATLGEVADALDDVEVADLRRTEGSA